MLLRVPDILKADELGGLRRELAGAAFEEGKSTAGFAARGVKKNLQLAPSSPVAQKCAPIVMSALARNPVFFAGVLPHRVQGPAFNRYETGMTYGDHIDNAIMGTPAVRADVAATVFLGDPGDYDGGELVVQDNFGAHQVKLPAGAAVVYPASSVHRVQPVTRGTRLAAVVWIQSLVRDTERRRVLFDLDIALGALRAKQGEG